MGLSCMARKAGHFDKTLILKTIYGTADESDNRTVLRNIVSINILPNDRRVKYGGILFVIILILSILPNTPSILVNMKGH